MSFFRRLFGSRKPDKPPRYEYDLRDEGEIQMERAAHCSLGGEDEKLARKLAVLCDKHTTQYRTDRSAADATHAEIRRIGEYLGANGGSDRMKRVAYRTAILQGVHAPAMQTTDLEAHWMGICGWRP